jgi:uncharacterized protein DUF6484
MSTVPSQTPPIQPSDRFLSTLELVVHRHAEHSVHQTNRPQPPAWPAAVIGRLVGFSPTGEPLVSYPASRDGGTDARTTVALRPDQIGSQVVLVFEGGDLLQPIVVGCLVEPQPPASHAPVDAELNGKRLELTAQEELVLRCGDSSITLTKAGKVLIRGHYLLSRSSGVNRIKGGSVQIN